MSERSSYKNVRSEKMSDIQERRDGRQVLSSAQNRAGGIGQPVEEGEPRALQEFSSRCQKCEEQKEETRKGRESVGGGIDERSHD